MATTIPEQERVIDPFASYNSNVVNRITEIVTHNSEGMLTVNSIQVSQDSTSPNDTVVVSTGYGIKDDVLIKITEEHTVDFNDDDQYIGGVGPTAAEILAGGNYYIVLDYQYVKQRPAPKANIRILKPLQRSLLTPTSTYLLLKVVTMNTSFVITAISDYDSEVGYTTNTRQYIRYYAGAEVNIPTFTQVRDQGRVAYESEKDKFYFGYEADWGELTAGGVSVDVNTDSTSSDLGDLCYVDSLGNAARAISTGLNTAADLIVTGIGTAVSGLGRGIVSGFGQDVPVETGILISVGDILYLSDVDAGTVTNVRPDDFYQVVGRALTSASSTTPVDMIFSPKLMLVLSMTGQLGPSWSSDGTSYYNDVNVVSLDGTSAFDCHWFNDATNIEITPYQVEIRSGGGLIRVSFLTDGYTINYIIQSKATAGSASGGGGGSGVSDHALLLSLDYASALHTGFAPDPHGNGEHSSTFITAAGVTYGNLAVNLDVGPAAGQVAIGNHTHQSGDTYNYNDVPSLSIILFESNTAIVGYTLLTDQDDMVVYITKGSAAGGETGGTGKTGGTWTQPTHTHSITGAPTHTHTTPAHTHKWYDYKSKGDTYSWLSDGATQERILGTSGTTTNGLMGEVTSANAENPTTDFWTANSAVGASGADGDHDHGGPVSSSATASTWRPRGRNLTRQRKI